MNRKDTIDKFLSEQICSEIRYHKHTPTNSTLVCDLKLGGTIPYSAMNFCNSITACNKYLKPALLVDGVETEILINDIGISVCLRKGEALKDYCGWDCVNEEETIEMAWSAAAYKYFKSISDKTVSQT
jgi:hypothetical protein